MFEAVLAGLQHILSIKLMLLMLGGSMIGMIFGFLPGLGGTVALAIFIPFTFGMAPNVAFAFLLGMHASVMFGGSISAILFNVPGTSQNVATCFDGHPLAQKGEAARAIGMAGMSSLIGGLFGALILALSLPVIRPFIMSFGPAEYFMLTVFGLSMIALLTSDSIIKGLIAGGLGLLVSFIGTDYITGTNRYTFGNLDLWEGINFIPVVIGLFAIAQMIDLYVKGGSIAKIDVAQKERSVFRGMKDAIEHWGLILRCSILGSFVGMIPGVGGTVANLLAYGHAMQTSKKPEEFGKGSFEGIIGPEASNNAKEGGSLIPTLAFGIPGSTAMAILLGAFLMMGIVPGPEMVTKHPDMIYMLVFIVAIGNIFATIIGFSTANQFQKLTTLPGNQLIPIIVSICLIGAFVVNGRMFDVIVALIFTVLGYFMKKFGYSRAAFIIALVLGTLFERYYHVSYRLYGRTSFFFMKRPIALVLLILSLLTIVLPFIQSLRKSGDQDEKK